jgi:tetratricopeptide (TPR) repeat protein
VPAGRGSKRPKSKVWTSLIWTIIPALAVFGAVLFWGVRAQNPITCTLRGAAKEEKGDLDGALAHYDQAIRFNPKSGLAYFGRGNIKRRKADLDGAMADYNEAIGLDPKMPCLQ